MMPFIRFLAARKPRLTKNLAASMIAAVRSDKPQAIYFGLRACEQMGMPLMRYWNRPMFWLCLLALEFAAFLLSAIAAMAVTLGCAAVGISHLAMVNPTVGLAINLYLGYEAFRCVRDAARRWPPPSRPAGPRGFPVIVGRAQANQGTSRVNNE